jgi:hypothetical protein
MYVGGESVRTVAMDVEAGSQLMHQPMDHLRKNLRLLLLE